MQESGGTSSLRHANGCSGLNGQKLYLSGSDCADLSFLTNSIPVQSSYNTMGFLSGFNSE